MRIEDRNELVEELEINNITDFEIFAISYSTGSGCTPKIMYSGISFTTKFNMLYTWYLRMNQDKPVVIISSPLRYSELTTSWMLEELITVGFPEDKTYQYTIKDLSKAEGYVGVNYMREHLFNCINCYYIIIDYSQN